VYTLVEGSRKRQSERLFVCGSPAPRDCDDCRDSLIRHSVAIGGRHEASTQAVCGLRISSPACTMLASILCSVSHIRDGLVSRGCPATGMRGQSPQGDRAKSASRLNRDDCTTPQNVLDRICPCATERRHRRRPGMPRRAKVGGLVPVRNGRFGACPLGKRSAIQPRSTA
jgi:hypothetical protein